MIFTFQTPLHSCYVWFMYKGGGNDPAIGRFHHNGENHYVDDTLASECLFGDVIAEPETWTSIEGTWKRNPVPYAPTKIS